MRQLYTVIITAITLSQTIAPARAQVAPHRGAIPAGGLPGAANPLLAEWTGAFGGVPPWDIVKPELFPAAFAAALAEEHREIEAIAGSTAAAHVREHDCGHAARREDTGPSRAAVLGHDVEHELAGVPGARPRVAAEACRRQRRDRLQRAAVQARRGGARVGRLVRAGARPAAAHELAYDGFVRRGAKLDAAGKAKLGEINQELAGLFSEFSNKVLADENTWIVLDSEADLAGLPASLVAAAKAAADGTQAGRQVGGRQHALERRSVPDVRQPARPAREGLEGVQEPRRQRRRERHQADHRPDREAARRARRAARLRDARALAHGRHHGEGSRRAPAS